jgi:hypothetical protein
MFGISIDGRTAAAATQEKGGQRRRYIRAECINYDVGGMCRLVRSAFSFSSRIRTNRSASPCLLHAAIDSYSPQQFMPSCFMPFLVSHCVK